MIGQYCQYNKEYFCLYNYLLEPHTSLKHFAFVKIVCLTSFVIIYAYLFKHYTLLWHNFFGRLIHYPIRLKVLPFFLVHNCNSSLELHYFVFRRACMKSETLLKILILKQSYLTLAGNAIPAKSIATSTLEWAVSVCTICFLVTGVCLMTGTLIYICTK